MIRNRHGILVLDNVYHKFYNTAPLDRDARKELIRDRYEARRIDMGCDGQRIPKYPTLKEALDKYGKR